MDFSSVSSAIGNNNILIAVILVLGVLAWKFLIEPIQNEHDPIPGTPEMDDQ